MAPESRSNAYVKRDVSDSPHNTNRAHNKERKKMKGNVIIINKNKVKNKRHKLRQHNSETVLNNRSLSNKYNTSMDSLHYINSTAMDSLLKKRLLFHRKHRKRRLHLRNNSFVNKSLHHTATNISNISDIAKKRNSRDYPYTYGVSPKHIVYTSNFLSKSNYAHEALPFQPLNFHKDELNSLSNSPLLPLSQSNKKKQLVNNIFPNMFPYANPNFPNNYLLYNRSLLLRHNMYFPNANSFFRKTKTSQQNVPLDVRRSMVAIPSNYLNPLTSGRIGGRKSAVPNRFEQQKNPYISKKNITLLQSSDIQPLSEFPTEDYNHFFDKSKDKILHPDELDMMMQDEVSDNDVDVPFPLSNQLPSPKINKKELLSYPPYLMRHYVAEKLLHKPPASSATTLNQFYTQYKPNAKLTSKYQSHSQSKPKPSNRHETYQKLFLQSKNSTSLPFSSLLRGNDTKQETGNDDGSNSSGENFVNGKVSESMDSINETILKGDSDVKSNKNNSTNRDKSIQSSEDASYRNRDLVPVPSDADVQKSIFDIRKIQKEVESYVKNMPISNLVHISDNLPKLENIRPYSPPSNLGNFFKHFPSYK